MLVKIISLTKLNDIDYELTYLENDTTTKVTYTVGRTQINILNDEKQVNIFKTGVSDRNKRPRSFDIHFANKETLETLQQFMYKNDYITMMEIQINYFKLSNVLSNMKIDTTIDILTKSMTPPLDFLKDNRY